MPTIDTCLMKKVVIPTILAATILVAGAFAMMPVQKASTIHSSGAGNILLEVTDANVNAADVYTVDCTSDAVVIGITATLAGTITDEDLQVAQGGENIQATIVFAAAGGQNLLAGGVPVPAAQTLTITEGAMTDAGDETAVIKVAVSGGSACTLTQT
jgi:hypothetical protein